MQEEVVIISRQVHVSGRWGQTDKAISRPVHSFVALGKAALHCTFDGFT